jgi:hypothetical protein
MVRPNAALVTVTAAPGWPTGVTTTEAWYCFAGSRPVMSASCDEVGPELRPLTE